MLTPALRSVSRGTVVAVGIHATAIVASLVHAVIDAGLFLALSPPSFAVFVAAGLAAYVLWVRSLSGLLSTGRGGRLAAAIALVWAGLANGGTIAFCPLQLCWPWATLLHVVVLGTALAAAIATIPYFGVKKAAHVQQRCSNAGDK